MHGLPGWQKKVPHFLVDRLVFPLELSAVCAIRKVGITASPRERSFHGRQMNEASRQSTDQIVQLLTNVQQQLTRYVHTLVPNRSDAEEVLQETNLFVWRHADEFELGTNFAAWACKIAYYQVLTFRKRQARSRLYFSDALVEQLASSPLENLARGNAEAEALELCMGKLSSEDRELM